MYVEVHVELLWLIAERVFGIINKLKVISFLILLGQALMVCWRRADCYRQEMRRFNRKRGSRQQAIGDSLGRMINGGRVLMIEEMIQCIKGWGPMDLYIMAETQLASHK